MTDRNQIHATLYVPSEGRNSLNACMDVTFKHCAKYGVNAVVIYTATGDGAVLAIDSYLSKPEFSQIKLVAVTPPAKRMYVNADPNAAEAKVRTGIFGERAVKLYQSGVPVISARLPFRSIAAVRKAAPDEQPVTDAMQVVDQAFGMLGGGFSICVQAALLACDAGAIAPGERVVAMSADTSVQLIATHSELFLSATHGLLVEHIICRPSMYTISKPDHVITKLQVKALADETISPEHPALLAEPDHERTIDDE